MRKLILAATGLVCLTGVSYFIGTAVGEGGRAAEDVPTKIGLIDVEYIFANYDKMKVHKQEWQDESTELQTEATRRRKQIQDLMQEMKTFNEGTPEYTTRERKYLEQVSSFKAFEQTAQRKMQRLQAQAAYGVYQDMQEWVGKVCNSKNYGYTIVLKFSREPIPADPQRLNEGLMRQVVFNRDGDDISEIVLKLMNKQYAQSQPASAAPSAAPPTTSEKEPTRKAPSGAVKQAGGNKSGPQK